MRYMSTRGSAPILDFEAATLAGLASDGGLYVPEHWPRLSEADIAAMAGLPYVDVAVRVCRAFTAGSLDDAALRTIFTAAYGRFAHAAVVPLKQLDHRHVLLELFHGPTLAFKDVALQALGLVFERFLAASGQHLTVIGATSGDTGSAAIDALAGRSGVEVYMLHPHGRVSEVQRRQMTTVLDANIHNIAIDGNFDDAQAIVKAMFNDAAFAARFPLAAVNSINWARLLFQVVYYFTSALSLGAPHRAVSYAVPTGNFGDVFAGYVAAQMGLPIERRLQRRHRGPHRCAVDGHSGIVQLRTPAVRSVGPRWRRAGRRHGRVRSHQAAHPAGTLARQGRWPVHLGADRLR
jgi:threonine synthase